MADNGFSFELSGIDEMTDILNQEEIAFFKNLDRVLTRLAEKVIQDARRLAPIDSGDLEAALDIGTVKTTLATTFIDFGVTVSPEVAPYAWAQHEGFRKTKSGQVVNFTPGPATMSKGPHKGFMPGKKFLQHAIEINEQTVLRELANAMEFGGGVI
ncbi:hypothetical protein [Planomicrobium sp. MB-3u-38]|uniref:hypothetical protein n=1 Tax=Planomicrobium sp. MB-3u-38 TaxID=2058318 RepID=UPI000C7A8209|nr:hypothetical protein [Planomicrobium sp. MB-3u-38]PKH09860.1 hypothetical protein CXF70_11655 [Planomicrobium sp. MB-3u-38]